MFWRGVAVMSCRSPVGNTPHMLHAFGLSLHQQQKRISYLRRRRGLAPRTASLGLRVRTLSPILMPESLASTVPPRLHIYARYYRVGQARQGRKGWTNNFFSLSLTMILSKILMNVKQISRFCKIILNDAYFFSLLSNIFSSFVFFRL